MNDLDYLLPATKEVLLQLANFDWLESFTFVGGSGLSLYLHHRLSEDIDLFTWEQSLSTESILPSLQNEFGNQLTIEQSGTKQIDLKVKNVQVTFFANNWDDLKRNIHLTQNLHVASPDLLVGMKLNTLFIRAKFRDYYDLYALSLFGYSISTMYEIIENMMPGMNKRLFQMALTYTEDIEDDNIAHLNPKYDIDKKQIAQYFEEKIFEWLDNK